jgi:drug/metabolite transporter (DMT)-like permease
MILGVIENLRLFGWWMLHETVGVIRWVGVVVICIDVLLVGRTEPSTTNNAATATMAP